ncbi:hypothetical protein L7F22_017083 [Adiantum nelumboides]|nr:hypothetical protein [Adiantum nelumboides]
MVLDIRKELKERKAGHPITASIVKVRSRTGDLYVKADGDRQASETINGGAESIAGPCSPPAPVFSRKIDLAHPYGSYEQARPPQPRPLRMPCSACTFVPAPHTHHNIQHNIDLALLSRTHTTGTPACSQRDRAQMYFCKQGRNAGSSHAPDLEADREECVEIEEPGVEDIAAPGGHGDCRSLQQQQHAATPSFNTPSSGNASFIEPMRVSCSACTSSLRAPFTYGQRPPCDRIAHPAKPKNIQRIKQRDKGPQLADSALLSNSTTAEDMATAPTSQEQRNELVEPLTTAMESSQGWYIRAKQESLVPDRQAIPAASDYAKSMIEEYVSNSSLEDVVEAVGGANQHEGLEVTYQSTRDREEIIQHFGRPAVKHRNSTRMNEHDTVNGHDCFVKRVERACATACRSASAGSKCRSSASHEYGPASSAAARRRLDYKNFIYADYKRPASRTNRLHRSSQRSPVTTDSNGGAAILPGINYPRIDDDVEYLASPMNETEDRGSSHTTQHRQIQQYNSMPPTAVADTSENIVQTLMSHDDGPISCLQEEHTSLSKEAQGRNRAHIRPVPRLQKKKLMAYSRPVGENSNKLYGDVPAPGADAPDNQERELASLGGQAKQGSEERGSLSRGRERLAALHTGGGGKIKKIQASRSKQGNGGSNSCGRVSIGSGERTSGAEKAALGEMEQRPGQPDIAAAAPAAGGKGSGNMNEGGGHIEEVQVSGDTCSSGDRGSDVLGQQQELKLSVEVFPSPSARKGFGLKITQHFPKAPQLQVEYVNSLGLSPRSFQTLHCQRCTAAAAASTS